LPLRNVVFGVTLRLLVIHFVIVSRHINKLRRLPATIVINLPWFVAAKGIAVAVETVLSTDEARYWLRLAISVYPTCILRTRQGGFRRNIAMTFGMVKREWCGFPTMENYEDMLIRFDRMYERDRRTDTT